MTYAEKLSNKFNEAGIKEWDPIGDSGGIYTPTSKLVINLSYLPELSIENILSIDLSGCKKESDIIQKLGEAGLLKTSPKIVDLEHNPALMLRYNRYLHLFRGSTFQVSTSPDAVGVWANSYWTITSVMDAAKMLRHSRLSVLLMIASAVDAAGKLDCFWGNNITTPISEFFDWLDKALKYWGISDANSAAVFQNNVRLHSGTIPTTVDKTVLQFVKDNRIWVRAVMFDNAVEVEFSVRGCVYILHCDIPDWLCGMGEDDFWRFDNRLDAISTADGLFNRHHREIHRRILNMLLACAGINLNTVGWMFTKKIDALNNVNFSHYLNVGKIDDLDY